MYKSMVLAGAGLLAFASAAPLESTCTDGFTTQTIRFGHVKSGTAPPDGFKGYDWAGLDVFPTPTEKKHGVVETYKGSSAPNVVYVTGKKYGGRIILPGGPDVTFGIKSFDAACFYAVDGIGADNNDCAIQVGGFNGDSTSIANFNYTASKYPTFTKFNVDGGDEKYYQFFVTGPKENGEKPTLALDNIVVQRPC